MANNTQSATPRPVPTFIKEPEVLSTKRESRRKHLRIQEPDNVLPPKPPRSAPPISRLKPQRPSASMLKSSLALSPNVKAKLETLNVLKEGSIENLNRMKSILSDNYIVIQKLGSGSFGEVYKVQSKTDKRYYAVKRTIECFKGSFDRKQKRSEVEKYKKIPEHPNCVKFFKAWEEGRRIFILTELCHCNLEKHASKFDIIPEIDLCHWIIDLLKALSHLHRHNFVHMDVKPDNIFIGSDSVVKLGDYGIMYDRHEDKDKDAQEGDPRYLAPEVMSGQFDTPADIFSLGVTLLELAGDVDLPKGGNTWHQLRTGKLPECFLINYSEQLKSIIEIMLNPDPKLRPTSEELLSLPYFITNSLDRQKPLTTIRPVINILDSSADQISETSRSPTSFSTNTSDDGEALAFPLEDSLDESPTDCDLDTPSSAKRKFECKTEPIFQRFETNLVDTDENVMKEDHCLVRNLMSEFGNEDID